MDIVVYQLSKFVGSWIVGMNGPGKVGEYWHL